MPVVPCASLSSPGSLRLVTFDVFAALMETKASLENATAAAIPSASSPSTIVDSWVSCYGSYAGITFDPASFTPQPFPWIVRHCLWQALNASGLGASDGPGTASFEALAVAWSTLTPWSGTADALRALAAAGLRLGALSNGDRATLSNATAVFLPGVPFWRVFPSDYPVGAFKPAGAMYQQVMLAVAEQGWPPEAALHAAGSPADAQGAREFGMLAVLIAHGAQPDGPPSPCAVLDNITLLPGYLNVDAYPSSSPPPPPATDAGGALAPGATAGLVLGVGALSALATLAATRALGSAAMAGASKKRKMVWELAARSPAGAEPVIVLSPLK